MLIGTQIFWQKLTHSLANHHSETMMANQKMTNDGTFDQSPWCLIYLSAVDPPAPQANHKPLTVFGRCGVPMFEKVKKQEVHHGHRIFFPQTIWRSPFATALALRSFGSALPQNALGVSLIHQQRYSESQQIQQTMQAPLGTHRTKLSNSWCLEWLNFVILLGNEFITNQ